MPTQPAFTANLFACTVDPPMLQSGSTKLRSTGIRDTCFLALFHAAVPLLEIKIREVRQGLESEKEKEPRSDAHKV